MRKLGNSGGGEEGVDGAVNVVLGELGDTGKLSGLSRGCALSMAARALQAINK